MDFDGLLRRYFGISDSNEITPAVKAAGCERMLVDFGLERDRAKRFALWSLLYMLDASPALDVAFEGEADREAARTLMDMLAAAKQG